MARIPLRPLPCFMQFAGEEIGVAMALTVASRARVAVPVPGAAHPVASLQNHSIQTKIVAKAVQLIEPGEARANHDRIQSHACSARTDVRHKNLIPRQTLIQNNPV